MIMFAAENKVKIECVAYSSLRKRLGKRLSCRAMGRAGMMILTHSSFNSICVKRTTIALAWKMSDCGDRLIFDMLPVSFVGARRELYFYIFIAQSILTFLSSVVMAAIDADFSTSHKVLHHSSLVL